MRIIFMGTPDFAVPALVALHDAGHTIMAVYTQPPRPAGRGKKLQPSPVQKQAEALGLPVRHPVSLRNSHEQQAFSAFGADIAIVAAYGLILPQAILDAPRHGCINIHASLLPRWRGAAPIHRAIMAGDDVTGVTIMQMAAGLDTGAMLTKVQTPVADKTTGELTAELAQLGAAAIVEALAKLPDLDSIEQDDNAATYAKKIDKAEARIDWDQDAEAVERTIRALAPFPGAWFELNGERIKVLKAEIRSGSDWPGVTLDDNLTIACQTGAIRPLIIQRAGKPKMHIDDFLRGSKISAGTKLV